MIKNAILLSSTSKKNVTPVESSVLLHMDDFSDAKGHQFRTIGAPSFTTSAKKFGTSSLNVSAANQAVRITNPSDLQLLGDFTIDFWLGGKGRAYGNQGIMGYFDATFTRLNLIMQLYNDGRIKVYTFDGQSNGELLTTTVPISNVNDVWTHVALTKQGSTWRLFLNGRLDVSSTNSSTQTSVADLLVGAFYLSNVYYSLTSFYIDEFRLVNGEAVWTTDFIPPTSPYMS